MAQTIKLRRSATAGATPTTSQLELGEVAINTYDGKMYIKKSVGGTESIVELGSGLTPADAILEEYLYTATASQTAFSGNDDNSDFLSYTAGALQVFLNGILLDPETDYTATNGSTITLTQRLLSMTIFKSLHSRKRLAIVLLLLIALRAITLLLLTLLHSTQAMKIILAYLSTVYISQNQTTL